MKHLKRVNKHGEPSAYSGEGYSLEFSRGYPSCDDIIPAVGTSYECSSRDE